MEKSLKEYLLKKEDFKNLYNSILGDYKKSLNYKETIDEFIIIIEEEIDNELINLTDKIEDSCMIVINGKEYNLDVIYDRYLLFLRVYEESMEEN